VDFIEERREDILLVSNAALRYAPSSLSAGEIEEAVFLAGLAGMDEARRAVVLEARREAQKVQAAGQDSRNAPAGLAGLLAPMSGGRMRPPGGNPGGRGGNNAAQGTVRAGGNREAFTRKTLWFMDENGRPACVQVEAGISDGSLTEIRALGGEELEGREIILRERI
jgi:hypothetical protein